MTEVRVPFVLHFQLQLAKTYIFAERCLIAGRPLLQFVRIPEVT